MNELKTIYIKVEDSIQSLKRFKDNDYWIEMAKIISIEIIHN